MLEQNSWQLQQAKAHFSELIRRVSKGGAQTITKQGRDVAIIISMKQYQELTQKKDSLLNFFKASPYPDVEIAIKRSKDKPREFDI